MNDFPDSKTELFFINPVAQNSLIFSVANSYTLVIKLFIFFLNISIPFYLNIFNIMLNLLKYKNQIIIHYIIQIYKYEFFLINHKHILFMLNNMINEQLMHQFIFLLYR